MPLTLGQVAAAVDRFAPWKLAYDWDNVGLQVGDANAPVSRMLVALELNERVLDEAASQQCEVILTHHPLIFHPLKAIRSDLPQGRLQARLLRENIGLIAAHTNLDRVLRGTNGALAEAVRLRDAAILEPATSGAFYKLIVFVPPAHTPKLIDAIHRGGGGRIGTYSHCTFRSPGTGTYVPEEGSNPHEGRIGSLEQADEDRLESLVSEANLARVIQELRQAHPYEEPGYDVVPMHDAEPRHGLGVIGDLPLKLPLRALTQAIREACGAPCAQFAGDAAWPMKRAAIITGSAGNSASRINQSVADVLITGELNYHQTMEAVERGVGVIALGHAVSERIFAPYFCREFLKESEIENAKIELIPFTDFPEPWQLVQKSTVAPAGKGRK